MSKSLPIIPTLGIKPKAQQGMRWTSAVNLECTRKGELITDMRQLSAPHSKS